MIKNEEYLLALHSVNGLGPIRLKALLDYFQDPILVWQADIKELISLGIPRNVADLLTIARKKTDPAFLINSLKKDGIKWMTVFDEDYPALLKEIDNPPIVLYYTGEIITSDKKAVAVVGTRKISGYGRLVTEKFAGGLSNAGVTVVSGLARGVDTVSHQVTVKEKGRTLAVLGGGLKNIFPPENIQLARRIGEGFGAVISEFAPESPSLPGNFPARNRIISGLSLGVLVTEAAEGSGSLITAKCALEQGREVFAVPGPITSGLSAGPSLLIKEGAKLVTNVEEILEELGLDVKSSGKRRDVQENVILTEVEQTIVACLTGEKHIDEICRETKLPVATVSATLIKLEIIGILKSLGAGIFTKVC